MLERPNVVAHPQVTYIPATEKEEEVRNENSSVYSTLLLVSQRTHVKKQVQDIMMKHESHDKMQRLEFA